MATETVQPPETNGRTPEAEPPETGNSRAWHEWLAVGVALAGLLSIAAIIVSVVALSSKNPNAGPRTVTVQAANGAANSTPAVAPLSVKMTVKSDTQHARKGPDGQWHDAILGGNLTVKAGQAVTVTVSNYDDAPHSYTAPDLNLNVKLPGAKGNTPGTVKFTFKAPAKAGTYQWFCAYPCDPWAMAHDGFMRGHVTVTA